jgi:hypothetical protein
MMIRLRDWFPEPTPAHTPKRIKKKREENSRKGIK